MIVLVDTSVWIGHFRKSDPKLAGLLDASAVATHPLVVGELACGNLPSRGEVLRYLRSLPKAVVSDPVEILNFIEAQQLWGLGVGLTDINLIASSLLSHCKLWTHDKRLADAAAATGVQIFKVH